MKERAVKEPDGLEQLAAEQGPRWPSRKAAWLDGFREGAQHARMTGVPQQRVNALVEALEEVQGEIYLWQIGEGPWQGEPSDLIAHLHKTARAALANYKEGEA